MKPLQTLITLMVLAVSGPGYASSNDFYDEYQLKMLNTPSEAILAAEREGRINIYMGLTDKQVDAAMDEQFDRIDAMMFAGVIVTDAKGYAKTDPATGEYQVEEDGCD